MRILTLVLAFGAVLTQASARPAILAANKTLVQGVAKGSIETIMSVYAAQPEMAPPDGPVASGREAVQRMWKGFLDQGTNSLELVTTDVDTNGNSAIEQGKFTSKKKDGSGDHGQYASTWIREKGAWKLRRIEWK